MKNSKLTLASGRTIQLVSLRQEAVYYGLLEGLPTRDMNADTIERLIEDARERTGHEPLLITPRQTPIERHDNYQFGEPAQLPAISCVGSFVSSGSSVLCFTSLTVIWFQDEYAFPLGAEAEAALRAIDWDAHAVEEEK